MKPATKRSAPPKVQVVIEVPRGSIFKRGPGGNLDFVSPLPCPYNYGSVHNYLGLEGDLLDALVLGPRLEAGASVEVRAWGAVGLADRGLYDDKLICAVEPPSRLQRRLVTLFFRVYSRCKGILNLLRGQPGRTAFVGWFPAEDAIARAEPLSPGATHRPRVSF
jgi:inorganic pyrophosphatase